MEITAQRELSTKNRKIIFFCFSLACFIAAGVCIIVNIAIERQITWAAYPLISIPLGWAVLSPILIKKRGIALSLCSLTLICLPYLYFLSGITPATDWFMPLGLPSAAAGIVSAWVLFVLFRFVRISGWYKAAISTFWFGAIIDPIIDYFLDIYLGSDPFLWERILSAFACIVATAVLGIIGYGKSKERKKTL